MSNSTQKSYSNKKIRMMGTIIIPFLLLAILIKPLASINVIVDSEAIIYQSYSNNVHNVKFIAKSDIYKTVS